jgi:hypothetical protein
MQPSNVKSAVIRYIDAMQSGDVRAVKSVTVREPALEYPGGVRFSSIDALLDWARGRHRGIHHDVLTYDEIGESGDVIAYVSGILSGTWLDGSQFEGIRFIYRFTVSDERITAAQLWSDIADALRKKASA